MSGDQKAQQCRAAFDAAGMPCTGSVQLTCHFAGGYPKRKCSEYCHEQDSKTARYVPPTSYVAMNTLYGEREGSCDPSRAPCSLC